MLYECLTGRTPYPGDNFEQQITAHLMDPPPRPSNTDPNVPATFDPVIATGMAKDPDQRYATTVELASAAHHAVNAPRKPPSEPTPLTEATQPAAEPVLATTRRDRSCRGPTPPTRPATYPTTPTRRSPGPRRRRTATTPVVAPSGYRDSGCPAGGVCRCRHRHCPHQPQHRSRATRALSTADPHTVLKLALPFTGLNQPDGVAVDTAGNLYVTDAGKTGC